VALLDTVKQIVTGLGYELVELERSAGGTLRITIDLPWDGRVGADAARITVDDCEKATRQLQYTLEVEGVDYRRLEVSSPGIDRPLRDERDFERFAGEVVDITLKAPIGAAGAGQVAPGRKKFRGTLERTESGWQLVWRDELPRKPGQKPGQPASRRREPPPQQALGFTLGELREARLAPIVDFKGRQTAPPAPAAAGDA